MITCNFVNAISCTIWSNALWQNEEYIGTTGINFIFAIPAAIPIACCSAIPTSKNLSGYFFANYVNPVPSFIEAVIATIFLLLLANFTNVSPITSEYVILLFANSFPVSILNFPIA